MFTVASDLALRSVHRLREFLRLPLVFFIIVLGSILAVTKIPGGGAVLLALSILIVLTVLATFCRTGKRTREVGLRDRAVFSFAMPLASLVFILPFFSDPHSGELFLLGLGFHDTNLSLETTALIPFVALTLLILGALVGWMGNPVLLILSLSLAFVYKEGVSHRAQSIELSISSTDWFLPWLTLFTLIAAFSILNLLEANSARNDNSAPQSRDRITALAWFSLALMVSSYFYSGVKKLFLGDSLLDWILNNPTQYLVGHAQSIGLVPLYGEVTSALWQGTLDFLVLPGVIIVLNAITVLTQIGSPAAFLNPRARSFIIFLLELEHVAIFLLTGIFFYKWIAIMLLVGIILHREKLFKIPETIWHKGMMTLAVGALSLSAAPFLQMPILGWWDSALLLRVERNVSVAESRVEVSLPPSLALQYSLTIAQSRDVPYLDWIPAELQKNKSLGAVPTKPASMTAEKACSNPSMLIPSSPLKKEQVTAVSRAIKEGLGVAPYANDVSRAFWFPHHTWTGVRSLRPFESVRVLQFGDIEESLVITCIDETLGSQEILRVPAL